MCDTLKEQDAVVCEILTEQDAVVCETPTERAHTHIRIHAYILAYDTG